MAIEDSTDAVLGPTTLVKWDISLDDEGDILTSGFFDTSLLVSLFCERRASASEVANPIGRRGWIGNESFVQGFQIGSKIWLFEQSRLAQNTLNNITSAAQESLQWLIDGAYVDNVIAKAVLSNDTITLNVEIFRANSPVDRRLFPLWDNSGVTSNSGD